MQSDRTLSLKSLNKITQNPNKRQKVEKQLTIDRFMKRVREYSCCVQRSMLVESHVKIKSAKFD